MKFKDIKKFTSWGSYEVDVSLYNLKKTIEEYKIDGLKTNPDFQRGHIWNTQKQIDYVEYFLRGGKTARVLYFNNPNWSILRDEYLDFVLVDGLQRLTALLKFMDNSLPIFDGNYLKDFEDTVRMIYTIKFNINDLCSRNEVLNWYIEMNEGGVPHTKEEIEKVRKLIIK